MGYMFVAEGAGWEMRAQGVPGFAAFSTLTCRGNIYARETKGNDEGHGEHMRLKAGLMRGRKGRSFCIQNCIHHRKACL